MKLLSALLAALVVLGTASAQGPRPAPRLVAIFVIDGLRPDSITPADTPTIARLRDEGTNYVNGHSVFPTATRVNATSLATGTYPEVHGIVGNSMLVPGVNEGKPFDTGDYLQLLKLEEVAGRTATTDTLGEVLQRNGRKLVTLSSGTTGCGFTLNPTARQGAGVAIHGRFDPGKTEAYPGDVSEAVIKRFGAPPDKDAIGQMNWTDAVLRDYVLPDLRPDVVIDWIGPLDSAQHSKGVGSPEAKEALRQIDASLARTIQAITALGLIDRTDIIVTSDHGFAQHTEGVNVAAALKDAGLQDVVMASQSQSILFYVPGHQPAKLVQFLQQQPWVDVIFTRGGQDGQGGVPGTFSMDLVGGEHPSRAADVEVSLAWTSNLNPFGVAGTHTIASSRPGPLQGGASGHGGLNPWVVRSTFVAWGADVKKRARVEAPASLPDVAPTVLTLLGLPAASGDGRGRVLRELLADGPEPAGVQVTRRELTTSAGSYHATVQLSTVEGHTYVDGGARIRN